MLCKCQGIGATFEHLVINTFNMKLYVTLLYVAFFIVCFTRCSTPGPGGLFGKKTPHEQYAEKLEKAGLRQTNLGRQWFVQAANSLQQPVKVNIPFSQVGYFAAEQPSADGIVFAAKRGQQLTIKIATKPDTGFIIFADLWQPKDGDNRSPRLLQAADTTNLILFEVKRDGNFQLRLQPELLQTGQYDLNISIGPSLSFPVTARVKSSIQSFWGVDRDGGQRRHEGIDIFAPRRTALVAAANGVVTRVNENSLGGKVVFMQPDGKDYSLYYAHLDEQLVTAGQQVAIGDTLGLMGNTGNAAYTSPHLHFGIYTRDGAVDPLPFVDRNTKLPPKISASTELLNDWAAASSNTTIYTAPDQKATELSSLSKNSVIRVMGASGGWYKVQIPNRQTGYVYADRLSKLRNTANLEIRQPTVVLDAPTANAPAKQKLVPGNTVKVLGRFEGFQLIRFNNSLGWIAL